MPHRAGQHRRMTGSGRLGSSCCDLQPNGPSRHDHLSQVQKKTPHSVPLPDKNNEDNLSISQRHSPCHHKTQPPTDREGGAKYRTQRRFQCKSSCVLLWLWEHRTRSVSHLTLSVQPRVLHALSAEWKNEGIAKIKLPPSILLSPGPRCIWGRRGFKQLPLRTIWVLKSKS